MNSRKLLPVPHDDLLRCLSDDAVEMGLYPVLFGWRVRAGKVGDMGVWCDWCCGDDPYIVFGGYSLMRRLLTAGVELEALPRASDPKPFPNDASFMAVVKAWLEKVGGWAPQEEEAILKESFDLVALRKEFMSRMDPHQAEVIRMITGD